MNRLRTGAEVLSSNEGGDGGWDVLTEMSLDDSVDAIQPKNHHERPEWMESGEDRRIEEAYNQVGSWDGPAVGKSLPHALSTNPESVYRVTGDSQVEDIVDCGYVRPAPGKVKGGSYNKTCWSRGGDKLFYFDYRPVIQASAEKVKDGQIGAIPLDDLEAIYIFDQEKQAYMNKLDEIKATFAQAHEDKS